MEKCLIGLFEEQPEPWGNIGELRLRRGGRHRKRRAEPGPAELHSGASEGAGPDLCAKPSSCGSARGEDRPEATDQALEDHLFSTERVRGCTLYAPSNT